MSDAAAMETDAKGEGSLKPTDMIQELDNASAYVAERSMADLLPLPPGWQEVKHRSNLSFYFHESSGCCVWSRPYVLPQPRTAASVQEHDPPLAAFTREIDGEPCTLLASYDFFLSTA